MSDATLAALIDATDPDAQEAWAWGKELRTVFVEDPAEITAHLTGLLEEGIGVVALQGKDRFCAQVLTAHQRILRGHTTPLEVFPLPINGATLPAAIGGETRLKRAAARLVKKGKRGDLTREMVPMLKVSSSLHPHAWWAFRFGAGYVYDLQEAAARGQIAQTMQVGQLVAKLVEELREESDAANADTEGRVGRFMLDGQPKEGTSYVLASSLPTAFFDVAMSKQGGARVRYGAQAREFAASVAKSRAPLAGLRGEGASFEALTFDLLERFVLDGELIAPAKPFALRVEPGTSVAMLR